MTQLCVTIPAVAAPAGRDLVKACLAAGRIAAVVLVPADGQALEPSTALPLIADAQTAGAAALVYGDAQLARVLKADGVHLPWSPTVAADAREAREILGPGKIVGAEAGVSRHDAMELGELGVDYVAFGPGIGADGVALRLDLIGWWTELFEVPVVAFGVTDADDAAALAAADADFVSVTVAAQSDGASVLTACAAAIAAVHAAPVA
jgi:thiamine-phosphate pyrophosphorylase